jgi:hypothetical protein
MAKQRELSSKHLTNSLKNTPRWTVYAALTQWHKSLWHKIIIGFVIAIALLIGTMYGIARWYMVSVANQPQVIGASFIPDYATSLGLDPQKTLDGMLGDLHIKHLRLVSYWSDMEPSKGNYDFTQLDWQFKKAEAAHAKVSLSLGLRQPRWPECHMPNWAKSEPTAVWYGQLNTFIGTIIDRYKSSPSLDSYQLENEYFLQGFGECTNFDRNRLVSEAQTVKQHDSKHTLIISRSNNALGIPLGDPKPDEYAVSVYKRVWDGKFSHRYLEYPPPAWFYAFLAGWQKLHDGRNMVVHEMQAEAWAPNNKALQDTSLAEQNKSLDAARLKGRFEYGKGTGMRSIDMWGAEYWYYRAQYLHDPSLLNVARSEYAKLR